MISFPMSRDPEYMVRYQDSIPAEHRKVIQTIIACRTEACGLTLYQCTHCGEPHWMFRSCGNRHCPQCQHQKNEELLVVAGGALSTEDGAWHPSRVDFYLPVKALSTIYRAKFPDEMGRTNLLDLIPEDAWTVDWNVNCQAVGASEASLKYLAPYVFRVAISENRIVKVENRTVFFHYRKPHSSRLRTMALDVMEFIRRFLQHAVLTHSERTRPQPLPIYQIPVAPGFLNPAIAGKRPSGIVSIFIGWAAPCNFGVQLFNAASTSSRCSLRCQARTTQRLFWL